MENPIKMDDLGVPLFSETSVWHLDGCQVFPDYFVELCFKLIRMTSGNWGTVVLEPILDLPLLVLIFFKKVPIATLTPRALPMPTH